MNRLSKERSPYLKQHAENPVDWYPWGPEALAKAKTENKPILLSVGYSACHWCHVMAHESFENEQIAKLMNEHFVNIKVDREERPDLDQIYQTVAQMLTKSGGWPLTVFLTPELQPFYGGTYFPPTDRYGRPGFPKLLLALAKAYRDDQASILDRAQKMTEVIREQDQIKIPGESERPADFKKILSEAARSLLSHVDWKNGGIGSAPKFPNVSAFSFLWRMSQISWFEKTDRESAREAVVLTLEKMACGGIFDQLGGGFSRYSVDDHWSVPHFEKMLYDNALLLKLYSEVLLTDKNLNPENTTTKKLTLAQQNLFQETLEKTVTYLSREMCSPQGLFYAAQDADSAGEEGKFFVWTRDELAPFLTGEELEVFCQHFGVTENGNFENGATVLSMPLWRAIEKSELVGTPVTVLNKAIQKIFLAREKRIRPGLDNKILVSWNSLMISGLSWASLAMQSPEGSKRAKEMAIRAYDALVALKDKKGRFPKTSDFLDDYAFFSQASLDVARVNPGVAEKYWSESRSAVELIRIHFDDPSGLGFFFTADDHETLIHRPKSLHDQAIPSGTGVGFGVFSVLGIAVDWNSYAGVLGENAFGMSEMLSSLLLSQVGPVLLKGNATAADLQNPFYFLESPEFKSGTETVQYCHRETCVLGKFSLDDLQE